MASIAPTELNTPRSSDQERRSTGIERLDHILGGGLPPGSATLVCGEPFSGKTMLAKLSLLQGLREGIPAIVLTTDIPAERFRAQLAALDEDYPGYEADGLVWYVDTYSRAIGADDPLVQTHYLDSANQLEALRAALERARAGASEISEEHVLVVDSLTTLLLSNDAQEMLPFLQQMLGQASKMGAVTLLSLERGVHKDREVELVRHLVDGTIDLRVDNTQRVLQVEGPHVREPLKWIEYEWGASRFEITGSTSSSRIR